MLAGWPEVATFGEPFPSGEQSLMYWTCSTRSLCAGPGAVPGCRLAARAGRLPAPAGRPAHGRQAGLCRQAGRLPAGYATARPWPCSCGGSRRDAAIVSFTPPRWHHVTSRQSAVLAGCRRAAAKQHRVCVRAVPAQPVGREKQPAHNQASRPASFLGIFLPGALQPGLLLESPLCQEAFGNLKEPLRQQNLADAIRSKSSGRYV